MKCDIFKNNLRDVARFIKDTQYEWELVVFFVVFFVVSAFAVYVRVNGITYPIGFTDEQGLAEAKRILNDARSL